jgi:hypothetical protein
MTTEAAPAPVHAGGRRSLRPVLITGAARPDHDGILQGSRAGFLARLAVV